MSLSSFFLHLAPSGDAEITPQSPLEIVDIRNDAVDLACRLGCLSRFLRAARKLLTCQYLAPDEFHRHSRKIICLVEIARRTLAAANVLPLSFHDYSSPFRPQKSAYLDLLRMLHDHRHHVDAALQDRLAHLLHPLASSANKAKEASVSAVASGELDAASSEGRPGRLATASIQQPLKRPHHKLVTNPERDPQLMPPPFTFSKRYTEYQVTEQSDSRTNQRLWDPEILTSAPARKSRKRSSRKEENDQENNPVAAEIESPKNLLRPLPRRFGIFCTGKISMHRQKERVGRPGGTSSLIKE